ncbi:unnamed protein product [Chrysoparadoxa australica]
MTGRTEVVPKSNDPSWDATIEFNNRFTATQGLVAVIYDSPVEEGQEPVAIGRTYLSLSECFTSPGIPFKSWYPLTSVIDPGAECGTIYMNVCFDASPAGSADCVDMVTEKLQGPRPDLLRFNSYYGAAKGAYSAVAGLFLVGSFASLLETCVEGVLSKTPLKPDEGKTVDSMDRTIEHALSSVDTQVDETKDGVLKSLKDLKDQIKGLKREDQSFVDAVVGGATGGARAATGAVTGTLGSIFNSLNDLVHNTASNVTKTAGDVAQGTTDTVGGALDATINTVGSVFDSTVSIAGDVTQSVKSTAGGITEKAISLTPFGGKGEAELELLLEPAPEGM